MPFGCQRQRSPVRYIRAPGYGPYGSRINRSAVSSGRYRYPRATPAPPINSSPVTPIGTGRKRRSSTYTRVFAIGRPIGIGVSADVIRQVVDQMVVSVGPYKFQRDEQRGSSSAVNGGSNTSPPQRIFMSLRPFQPLSISIRQAIGVACITVAP